MVFNGKLAAGCRLGTTELSFQLFQSPPWAVSDVPRALQLGNSSDLWRAPDVTRFSAWFPEQWSGGASIS